MMAMEKILHELFDVLQLLLYDVHGKTMLRGRKPLG
jgi:hypothetical protein